jgi:hypothetical protein
MEKHAPSNCLLTDSGWFLVLFIFDPEDGGDISFKNVGWLSAHCAAFYPRREKSSEQNWFQCSKKIM